MGRIDEIMQKLAEKHGNPFSSYHSREWLHAERVRSQKLKENVKDIAKLLEEKIVSEVESKYIFMDSSNPIDKVHVNVSMMDCCSYGNKAMEMAAEMVSAKQDKWDVLFRIVRGYYGDLKIIEVRPKIV